MINDDVFEMDDLPESVAVIGTGIIGLELGQALSRLGVRVSFFSPADTLGPNTDPEICSKIRAVLESELDLNLDTEVTDARAGDDGIVLHWRAPGGEAFEASFEKVLVAAGRRPSLAGLDLEQSGLPLDEKGCPPWDPTTTQCGDAPIFLAGDVSGHLPLLHEAADEGRIAGCNAMRYPDVTAHVRRTELAVAFTDPQLAMVGKSYAELDPDEIAIGEVSYDDQGRARVMGQNRGLVRIYASRETCLLLGAEMFGPRVEHMAHLLAWSVQQNLSVHRALEMPFYHPVVEEGLRTAIRDVAGKLRILGDCRAEDMAECPGA